MSDVLRVDRRGDLSQAEGAADFYISVESVRRWCRLHQSGRTRGMIQLMQCQLDLQQTPARPERLLHAGRAACFALTMTEAESASPYERLAQAATGAASVLQSVSGEGSVLDQMRRGQWAEGLTPQQAVDLTDLLTALMEHARRTRDIAGRLQAASGPMPEPTSEAKKALATTFETLLPLNRKERYYTGSVLPMLTASDGGRHLHRLLHLCGLDVQPLDDHSLDGTTPLQIWTEYSFLESRFTPKDKEQFADAPMDADTPDIVLVGADWLLAIEAKVFHRPAPAALAAQMSRQQVLVDYWTRKFNFRRDRVAHVLLLPEKLYADGVGFPVITWEEVLAAYRVVGPAYWVAMLEAALSGYGDLVSKPKTFGANASGHLTGQQILEAHKDGTLIYGYIGRSGGAEGHALIEDAATGRWRYQRYEVAHQAPPSNRNWFAVSEFLKRVTGPTSVA